MSAEMEQAKAQSVDMVSIEVDGIPLQAPKGSMIIEATDKAGIEVPRFCYHPKLSISASCRMCLVDVEKMPKPVPACATPVMDGMKVYTDSRRAMAAQHGVMEFLLINHPLDCPICDQGGECELQDLAMGYGRSVSRFTERKRVVKDKNAGPLIQTDMTRCIHCTRCVRFLEEIAGTSEMGGSGRGDRLEIGTCVENSINSELSGNIIDVCPVGALTNKPFRFAARAWELMAKPSVAAHDGVGSGLYYHIRRGQILRGVPRENESVNETWLADRDRYSHLGLYSDDRVLTPQVKENGEWKSVSWNEAIETVAGILRNSAAEHGPEQTGVLMSPSAASEEYFLAQSLVRQLGCNNIDHRLREQDFSDDGARAIAPDFGMKIADIDHCDAILLVGSNPREEAPIIGHRIRTAWRNGAEISAINPLDWPFTFKTSLGAIAAPQNMVAELAALAAAVEKLSGAPAPGHVRPLLDRYESGDRHSALAARLKGADRGMVLLGQFAMSHPAAACLRMLAQYIANASAAALNVLTHGGNANGAWRAGAVPHRGPGGAQTAAGLNAAQMLDDPRNCYLLWGIEPDYDIDNPARAMRVLDAAEKVVSVASYATDSLREISDVILPLAPLAESEGSLVNFDGATFSISAAGKSGGDARPGWKILRRLGAELGLQGFDQVSLGEVQAAMKSAFDAETVMLAEPHLSEPEWADSPGENGLVRIGELPMYSIDALCRRSPSLQQTIQAQSMFLGLNPGDAQRLGLANGGKARVRQGVQTAELEVRVSGRVPAGGAWLRSATCSTRMLEHAIAPVIVEVA
jgi:NADH-quinone oxidoreductase subunit G